ncbi:MAG: hypothetical protein CM15mP45_19860 [Deltaproteobacteria bacterium]|nr:MAG: hypothetical protein CM15mP45_19860 [Deltaproteobacteria bacterium]
MLKRFRAEWFANPKTLSPKTFPWLSHTQNSPSGPYFVYPTLTNSETTYRPLRRDINLLKQYLPWKFKVEKLLGQILRLCLPGFAKN